MSTPAIRLLSDNGTLRGYRANGQANNMLAITDRTSATRRTVPCPRQAITPVTIAGTNRSGLISGAPTLSGNSIIVGAGTTIHIARKKSTDARARISQDTASSIAETAQLAQHDHGWSTGQRVTVERMGSGLANQPLLLLAAAVFGFLGAILVISGLVALRRLRPLRFMLRTLMGLLLLSLGAVAGAVSVGMQGYRALTREDLAARIVVQPLGPQLFSATVHIPGRPQSSYYELAGDALYVDAHILKWHPAANIIGLHTAYELDRIAGRYDDIERERSAPRTVHSLAPVLDAEYGSGTFVRVNAPAEFEVRVSTTGLLIRPLLGSVQP